MIENEVWIKIAEKIGDIPFNENRIAKLIIGEKPICLILTMTGLKACSSKCPHAAGDLSKGFLDVKGNVTCPVHGYRFDLGTGRDTDSEGYFLKIYKVEMNSEGIFIKLA